MAGEEVIKECKYFFVDKHKNNRCRQHKCKEGLLMCNYPHVQPYCHYYKPFKNRGGR